MISSCLAQPQVLVFCRVTARLHRLCKKQFSFSSLYLAVEFVNEDLLLQLEFFLSTSWHPVTIATHNTQCLTPNECCRLTYINVQHYILQRDTAPPAVKMNEMNHKKICSFHLLFKANQKQSHLPTLIRTPNIITYTTNVLIIDWLLFKCEESQIKLLLKEQTYI